MHDKIKLIFNKHFLHCYSYISVKKTYCQFKKNITLSFTEIYRVLNTEEFSYQEREQCGCEWNWDRYRDQLSLT